MATTVHLAGDGVSLEADLRGPPGGQCVLLMHGGGQTRHAWKKAAETLAVTAPTLLVRGGMSEVVPPESAAHLLSLMPHAESVDIAGARHMVAGDRNDPFNDAVIEFLGRALGGSRGAPARQTSSVVMAG